MVQKMRASRVINFSVIEEMGANFKAFLPKRKEVGENKKQKKQGTTNTSLDSELEQLE
jgi:hypothetical protein